MKKHSSIPIVSAEELGKMSPKIDADSVKEVEKLYEDFVRDVREKQGMEEELEKKRNDSQMINHPFMEREFTIEEIVEQILAFEGATVRNPKQRNAIYRHRIIKQRYKRSLEPGENLKGKRPKMAKHESRSIHASNRKRGKDGRFLSKKEKNGK